jgi:hypothetical protein
MYGYESVQLSTTQVVSTYQGQVPSIHHILLVSIKAGRDEDHIRTELHEARKYFIPEQRN